MELDTPRLRLREFVEDDSECANAYEGDPIAVRFAPHGVRSLDDSLEHLRALIADSRGAARKIFDFAVVPRDTGRLIGRCGMRLSEAEPSEAMLWYVLARSAWGNGYATEAAHAVLAFGFEELRLHRIFLEIDPRNVGSLRVAEKLELRREAHLRENSWVKGEWIDTVVFARLDREHRALRKAGSIESARRANAPTRESRRG